MQPSPKHVSTTEKPITVCFSAVFSGPLPGKSDYCLGMLDWQNGHYQSGLTLLKLAAGWGNKNAQYTLGLIYYGGRHVPTDIALGMAWLKLANERHNDDEVGRATRSAFKWASLTQREQAMHLYRSMAAKYGDKVAAKRAWQHLLHWQSRHGPLNSGCVRVSGAQAAAARRLGLAGTPPQSIDNVLFSPDPISIPAQDGLYQLKMLMKAKARQRSFARARSGVCITIQTQHKEAQQVASHYFEGWGGVVTVGPLQAVPASASSSGR